MLETAPELSCIGFGHKNLLVHHLRYSRSRTCSFLTHVFVKKPQQERCLNAHSGEQQNGDVRYDLLQFGTQGRSGPVGEIVFEKNSVHALLPEHVQSFFSISSLNNVVTSGFKHSTESNQVIVAVFDAEHFRGRALRLVLLTFGHFATPSDPKPS